MSDLDREKQLAAARAVAEVQPDMLVGLGTGSTAAHVIHILSEKIAGGLRIKATATSQATENLARTLGVPLVPFDRVDRVDLTIDGADEVDRHFRAIKGGGGALLREKIVAEASDRVIVAVDSSKTVTMLGRFPLPVEVVPFAAAFVERRLRMLDVPVALRSNSGAPFQTDQGNIIFDVALGSILDPDELAATLASIPGIAGHGLFLTEIESVVVARGHEVEVMHRGDAAASP
ncbi:ribose-5-phosphate isomerase RpiA [Sphingopyxis sp. EG6]|uniref:ribose-5-phosphate isomerase RpiA n=1 Tax=Sphingopyxis sp. EG6 TaxID=1874061 RepID=UPI000DC62390|nr:ribose-5-phosphate isomerase RpiA [Sphingopyxis sp. EG6]BBB08707.1 ribose 5-phosphate isomerase [Sphingopyxis sp. EG6]